MLCHHLDRACHPPCTPASPTHTTPLQSGAGSGKYCGRASLAASACTDLAATPGCEAFRALCAAGSRAPQCSSPGPIPSLVSTQMLKDGIDSLCATHW